MSVRLIRQHIGGDKLFDPGGTASFTNHGGTAFVGWKIASDGTTQRRQASADGAYTGVGTWILPTINAGSYEVEAVLSGGPLTSGTTGVGVWQALSSTRTWTISSGGSDDSATITVSIRRIGTTAVIVVGTIVLTTITT